MSDSVMMNASAYSAQFTLDEILNAVDGVVVSDGKATINFPAAGVRVSTDSRTIETGDFFIPLSGPSFDGHHFLPQVFEQGAAGSLVSKVAWQNNQTQWKDLPCLIAVDDPELAYQQLGKYHRQRTNPKLVGITGSSGKTTIKEMLFAALNHQVKTQKTEKNFNNEIGVPKTLLALEPDTQVSIVEMAMRGLDQIRPLSLCACPDVAVVNNIGPAHIGLLGSLENIAQAKLEILEGLNPATGILLINADDALLSAAAKDKVLKYWGTSGLSRLKTYALSEVDEIKTLEMGAMSFSYQGLPVMVHQPGMHMVSNALAVIKIAELLGFPLRETIAGIATYQPVSGRWEKQALPYRNNAWVIDDAYNANPSSFKASLEAFLTLPKPEGVNAILVLGGMKELGDESDQYHRDLGQWLSQWLDEHQHHGVIAIVTIAEDGYLLAKAVDENNTIPVFAVSEATLVRQILHDNQINLDNTLVFIKGSRSVGLDKVAEALKEE